MSAEFLESLEARVAQAIDRLAALGQENEELRQRIAELEGELASKSDAPCPGRRSARRSGSGSSVWSKSSPRSPEPYAAARRALPGRWCKLKAGSRPFVHRRKLDG